MALAGINFDNVFGFISNVGKIGKDLREAITGKTITDPAKMQELANQAAEIEIKAVEVNNVLLTAQMEINKEEAKSSSKFISGWRPACGWLCVTGLAWKIFIHPIWTWIADLLHIVKPPDLEVASLVTILVGLLGLGWMRTEEKKHGVQNNH